MKELLEKLTLLENMSLINEASNRPCIIVDVQPEYTGINDGDELPWIEDMMNFLNTKSKILAFVNAEDDGLTADTIPKIKEYWRDNSFTNWNNIEFVDKGYGYFRTWMDEGISEKMIIKTIRLLYKEKKDDSRDLFPNNYEEDMKRFFENNNEVFDDIVLDDPLIINWTSVKKLKEFNNCYIMGGGINECLREVELLMNAFNIKYKRIQEFTYG